MQARKVRGSAVESLESRRLLSASAADIFVSPQLTLSPAATTSTPSGYSPAQIAKAYGFDSISFNGVKGDGAGQTIAIVDAFNDPNIASDLSVFSSKYGLPQANLSVVGQTGSKTGLPKTDAGWSGEIALDVEWAHAMAPAAKILLVEAKSDSLADLLAAVDTARSASGVSVVSMSWGTGEFMSETSYDSHFTTPAGHIGVTFVAASGDEGQWYGPEWPASSSNVLSVGGTTLLLDSAGNVSAEAPWSDSTGGTSYFEAAKSYQTSATGSYARTSPDVAFDADPSTGFSVYDSVPYQGVSGWQTVGGTSAGAPQWAALIAVANEGRALNGQAPLDGATGTLPALYATYATATSYESTFNDVTDTARQVVWGGRRVGWVVENVTTDVGYDTATGLGTPEAPQVVTSLISAKTAAVTTVKHATRVTISRRARRGDEVASVANATTDSFNATNVMQPAMVEVSGEEMTVQSAGNVMASLPKVTFVLAPVATATPVEAPHVTIADGGAATVVEPVVTVVPDVAAKAVDAVRPDAALEGPATVTVVEQAPVLQVVSAGAEHVAAAASAACAATVATVTDAAPDGWGIPLATAGAVLMFSWTRERVARGRAQSPDAVRVGPFNFVRTIGEA